MVKEMIHLTIDGVAVEVPKDTTILEAARSVGIAVPSLCYLKDLNQIAACRVSRSWWPPAITRSGRAWWSIPTPPGCGKPAG